MLRGNWMGREFGGECIQVCVWLSLCCAPKTITTLFIGHTPIQNKKFFKKPTLPSFPSRAPHYLVGRNQRVVSLPADGWLIMSFKFVSQWKPEVQCLSPCQTSWCSRGKEPQNASSVRGQHECPPAQHVPLSCSMLGAHGLTPVCPW